jgi:hypothetical protein
MMFLFVAMIHFPGALHSHNNRIIWTIVFREMSAAGFLRQLLMDGPREHDKNILTIVGRILIAITGVVFGIEHSLKRVA